MKWIGLTGGIATGKSTVASILLDLGLPVVDADLLAREVVKRNSPGLAHVVRAFGTEVLTRDGELNRKALGKIIFEDQKKREKLEAILHPLIQERRAEERRALERQNCDLAFYDVPLLFEKNMEAEFDATVLVYAPADVQRARLRARNHLTENEIAIRLSSQLPIDEKLKRATYVVRNEGSLADLRGQVKELVAQISN